ncbi:BolA-like protein 2 [Chionoecetes opilio]|uniref:BolA-like protein 2 n=1 Tax=Chionoecetes opilio TaxID=41210 RepID=A0A8J4YR64_CHIOP|nr:BolA-like protein 2 [Chionoecetes opilio]
MFGFWSCNVKLYDTEKSVEDQSDGCGAKFSVVVVAETFCGKPLLQRHRLVNAALQEELKEIHAFSMKTLTPEQWQQQQQQ